MKKKVSAFMTAALLLGILLSACAAKLTPTFSDDRGFAPEAPMPGPALAEQSAMDMDAVGSSANLGAPPTSPDRLVIRNASLSIVVDEPSESMKAISALAESFGGFVVDSYLFQRTMSNGLSAPSANITIRVPAERLLEALERIEQDARIVLTRNESGQDVTAQYTDLQSRLRNLQEAEVLLRQIMRDAEDTEDVLVAFHQLNSITEQIEVLKGQIKYYEESAALSAISVELIASQSVQPITIGGWEPVGVAKDAIQALVDALQGIVDALIWIVLYVLPILLVIGVPLWLLLRWLRRRNSSIAIRPRTKKRSK